MAEPSVPRVRRTRRTLAATAVSLATAFSVGTLEPWNPEIVGARVSSPDDTARFIRTLTLSPGVPLSVEATVGDITITGWDRPETSVEILRRAPTAARLAAVEPAIVETDRGTMIRVVQPEAGMDRSITSMIRISLPSTSALGSVTVLDGRIVLTNLTGGISANSRDGSIAANRLSGTIRLETQTGDITLDNATLSPDGLIRLRAFNGQIKVHFARRPENARILAVTFNGTISSELPLTMKDRFGPRFGEATIGAGSPVVSIDVVTGNIQIKSPDR